MKPENAQFLEQHKSIYEIFMRAQTITAMTTDIRENFIRILHEEFAPKYHVDVWCGYCVCKMVKDLYWYYNDWKEKSVMPITDGEPFIKRESF